MIGLAITEPTMVRIVMAVVFHANRQNGKASVAALKFDHTGLCG